MNSERDKPMLTRASTLLFVLCAGVWVGASWNAPGASAIVRADQPFAAPVGSTFGVGEDKVIAELRELNRVVQRIERRLAARESSGRTSDGQGRNSIPDAPQRP